MYNLKMVVANISHKDWWWHGKSSYKFETLKPLLDFMNENVPMTERDINFIIENDKKKEAGRLACTSWYEVEKGEHQMTEYTSF